MKLEIIFENKDLFAINKPADLLSVPGKGVDKLDSVQSRCQEICAGAMAVHRLDMATSGILLVSKHKEAERFYKAQFEQRNAQKIYHALVEGQLPTEGTIDFPLIVDWERRPLQKVCYETGKESLTTFKTLTYENSYSRVALFPHTGRSHQLRVHLAHLGFPIVGDCFYNERYKDNDVQENLAQKKQSLEYVRLMLHAYQLIIPKMEGGQFVFVSQTPF